MRNINYQKSLEIYLGLIAIIICVLPKMIGLMIAGLAVFVIIGYARKQIAFKFNKTAGFLALLYVIYVIGVAFTHNQKLASGYVENKLAMFVFPLLLAFRFKKEMDFRPAVAGLVVGVLLTGIWGFVNASHCYSASGTLSTCFTSGNFSHIHHPSYFSVFLLTAITAVWYGYYQRWPLFKFSWIIPFSLIALGMYTLCISLAALLFAILLGIIVLTIAVYKRFGKVALIIFLIVAPIAASVLFMAVPEFKVQFQESKKYFLEYSKDPENFVRSKTGHKEGSEVRLIMWTVAAHEFADHPWGVGTGNVDEHLSSRLTQYGQADLAQKDENQTILYNPHNQFLQTALEIGIVGLVVLVLMITAGIVFAWKNRNWVLLILLAGLVFNSLFESMLQRQSGTVFYSFWICILLVYSSSKLNNTAKPADKP